MTGFGRAVQEIDGYVITVELKSVNHRYFEFSSRVPRQYGFIEDKLKSFVNSRVSRGKVDCFVGIEALNTEAAQVAVNHTLAGAYNTALQEIADTYGAKQDWGAAAIARFPDVLVVRKAEEDEDKIWSYVQTVAAAALDKFVAMREVEGAKMKADVAGRAQTILDCVAFVEERSPQTVREYNEKLAARVHELLGDVTLDEGSLAPGNGHLCGQSGSGGRNGAPALPYCPAGQILGSRGAHRQKDGLPGAGNQPGGQHHWVKGPAM